MQILGVYTSAPSCILHCSSIILVICSHGYSYYGCLMLLYILFLYNYSHAHVMFLVLATPAEVIDHYYCFLSSNLDNSIICQNMLKLELISEEDLMISAKLCSDYKRNAFLLDQLLVADSPSIIKFCYSLKNGVTNDTDVGYMLVNGKNRSNYIAI